jgi:hypothetical protein
MMDTGLVRVPGIEGRISGDMGREEAKDRDRLAIEGQIIGDIVLVEGPGRLSEHDITVVGSDGRDDAGAIRISCLSSISWIQAMWMPSYFTAARKIMASICLVPRAPDVKWQAQQQTGFDAGHFAINWQAEQATCSEGHSSISWTPAIDNRKNEVIKIKLSTTDC